MKELTVKVDTSKIADILDGRATGRLKQSIATGVGRALAAVQVVHKTEVVGRGGGSPKPDVWTKRTNEAGRSFHIAWERGQMEGAYGSELARVGVLEMGTQEALGGPLRPKSGKYLAIPTRAARVGVGRAVWPRNRNDLVFAKSRRGTVMLLEKETGRLMYVLRTQVDIPARPTLEKAAAKSQHKVDQIMIDAATNWMRG